MLKSFPITDKCNICYDTFEETKDEVVVQLICGHAFHYDCILESYKMKTDKIRQCPYCRKDGGWLPKIEGEKLIKNIHKEWKNELNKETFLAVNAKFKTNPENMVYCPEGMCQGYTKSNAYWKKFNHKWIKIYNKCTTKAKKNDTYCGRHKSQKTEPLMDADVIDYLSKNKIYNVKTITSSYVIWKKKK